MKKYFVYLFLLIPFIGFGQFKSSIDLVGGLEYSYRVLDDEARGSSNSPFFDDRSGETGKLNYRFGLNFNHRIKSNIYFKTGVRFFKTGYQSEIKELRFGNDIQTGIGSGDITIESIPIRDFQIDYTHAFIEVPLVLRYEFKNHRLTPFFEVGMSPNFYIKTETEQLLDKESFGTAFSEKNANYNSISMVSSLSFGFNYQVNKHFQLFGQPIIRYHLTNLSKDRAQEHLYNFGIEIGVRGALK